MTVLDTPDTVNPPSDTDVDLGFAGRAAVYLRDQGLDPEAIVVALRTELGIPTPDAIRLAATNNPNHHP